jgi:outer membrane receptor for Fe3+-dicitrate
MMATSAMALLAGFGAMAAAQEAPAASGAPAEAGEEVVVTAQLRRQKLVEVPIAVTATTGAALERLGITKFDDLSLIVPGFEVQEQSANNTGFVIRGITSDSGSSQSEPRIAVFQDGVSASRNRGTYMELFDIERVEVARGPQATLFGRGALIGAVNVIQNKADVDGFGGSGALAAGDIDAYVEYSGTIWTSLMRRTDNPPRAQMMAELADWLKKNSGVVMLGALGFENNYALAMKRARAQQLGLASMNDLARVAPQLVFGVDLEFQSRPEWARPR